MNPRSLYGASNRSNSKSSIRVSQWKEDKLLTLMRLTSKEIKELPFNRLVRLRKEIDELKLELESDYPDDFKEAILTKVAVINSALVQKGV